MKKFSLMLFVLLVNITFAQSTKFIYQYNSVPDSTQKNHVHSEIMVLNINRDKSDYYGLDLFVSDSTLLADSKKGLMTMPPNKKMSSDRMLKTSNSGRIKFITRIGFTKYFVDENISFNWTLHSEYINVLNYKAQKATTEYGGRKWTAWFAKDIPFQDGPYKFKDLPGLIIKIEDETKSHQFELVGIRNLESESIYPELNNYKLVNVTDSQFVKAFKNYRLNPVADLVGQIPDQRDASGNFRKGTDIVREFEKIRKEDIAKDNNIIEIDLITK